MINSPEDFFLNQISQTKEQNLYKDERIITSCQSSSIEVNNKSVINLCSNNYLGLSSHPDIINAAKSALDSHGFGMSSVRFICGTQDIHKKLEHTISNFLSKEDTILYAAAFDANGGVFEPLLGSEDAIISDELNHASIIDGIRLCKAQRFRYKNSDMEDLNTKLIDAQNCRFKLIVTDGVFSMDGIIANLKDICSLAKKYDAMVMVDDSHGLGVLGENGIGSIEYNNVIDKVDIVTGTLGKALGGASGGYTSGKKEIITWLRQRSRPYLFSNTLAPVITATSIKAFELVYKSKNLRKKLHYNSNYFRKSIHDLGFVVSGCNHAIIPIIIKDAILAKKLSEELSLKGILVVSFSYPVVPRNKSRIRVQISSIHTKKNLDTAIKNFKEIGKKLKII